MCLLFGFFGSYGLQFPAKPFAGKKFALTHKFKHDSAQTETDTAKKVIAVCLLPLTIPRMLLSVLTHRLLPCGGEQLGGGEEVAYGTVKADFVVYAPEETVKPKAGGKPLSWSGTFVAV